MGHQPLSILFQVCLSKTQGYFLICISRSSRLEVFCTKGALRNCAKFTEKHLCQSLFFNKVASLRPATSFKKRLWHRCFSVNFAEFLRTPFITEHLWWLFLEIQIKSLEILFNPLQHGVAFLYPLKTSENY